jgi:hypothetical protein
MNNLGSSKMSNAHKVKKLIKHTKIVVLVKG